MEVVVVVDVVVATTFVVLNGTTIGDVLFGRAMGLPRFNQFSQALQNGVEYRLVVDRFGAHGESE